MGRPKGSKNKVKMNTINRKNVSKRGRPKGSKNYATSFNWNEEFVQLKEDDHGLHSIKCPKVSYRVILGVCMTTRRYCASTSSLSCYSGCPIMKNIPEDLKNSEEKNIYKYYRDVRGVNINNFEEYSIKYGEIITSY